MRGGGGLSLVHGEDVVLEVALLVGAVGAEGAKEGLLSAVDHEVPLHVVLGVAAVEGFVAEAAVDLKLFLLGVGAAAGGGSR